MDPISLIECTLKICRDIYTAHQQVKANREQVKLLGERVYAIQQSLERVAVNQIHAQISYNLNAVYVLLQDILNFIQVYKNKKSWFKRIISAGNDDARFINANRQSLFELNQIATQQQAILYEHRQDVEQALEQGLYCISKTLGEALGSIKQELARRDKVLLGRLDDVHGGIQELDVSIQGLRLQGKQQNDIMLLQLQSMQRQMANGFGQKEKTPIDPKLIIPLCELSIESECFAKGSFSEIYKAKHGQETVAVKLLPKMDAQDEQQFLREVEIAS